VANAFSCLLFKRHFWRISAGRLLAGAEMVQFVVSCFVKEERLDGQPAGPILNPEWNISSPPMGIIQGQNILSRKNESMGPFWAMLSIGHLVV